MGTVTVRLNVPASAAIRSPEIGNTATNAFPVPIGSTIGIPDVALYFFHYNFCRVYKTLRVTPAMEAGLSDHVWTLEELVSLLPERKPNANIDREMLRKALKT